MTKPSKNAGQKTSERPAKSAINDPKRLASACLATLEVDPENVHALRVLGELMRKQGKLPQAIKLLDKAATLAPDDVASPVLGWRLDRVEIGSDGSGAVHQRS